MTLEKLQKISGSIVLAKYKVRWLNWWNSGVINREALRFPSVGITEEKLEAWLPKACFWAEVGYFFIFTYILQMHIYCLATNMILLWMKPPAWARNYGTGQEDHANRGDVHWLESAQQCRWNRRLYWEIPNYCMGESFLFSFSKERWILKSFSFQHSAFGSQSNVATWISVITFLLL